MEKRTLFVDLPKYLGQGFFGSWLSLLRRYHRTVFGFISKLFGSFSLQDNVEQAKRDLIIEKNDISIFYALPMLCQLLV